MKARFTDQQPRVRWQPLDNGKVDVTICLNEKTILETMEISITDMGQQEPESMDYSLDETETKIETIYEYDFHQFREYSENIKKSDVENFPDQYMDYQPKEKEKTDEDRLEEMEKKLNAVLEVIADKLGDAK